MHHYDYGYFEEDQLAKIKDTSLWQRVLQFASGWWRFIAVAIVLSLLVTGAGLSLPALLKEGVDNYIMNNSITTGQRLEGITRLSLLFAALALFAFGAAFAQALILEWIGQNIMHDLRCKLYSHLQHLDLDFYYKNPAGKLVTRLTNDITNLHEMFTSVIVTLFNDFLQLGGILVILFIMNFKLTSLICLILPLVVLNIIWFSRLSRFIFRDIRTELARINGFLQESLSGISLIQSLSREKDTHNQFSNRNQTYFAKSINQIKIFAVFMPSLEFFSTATTALIIWYGGGRVIAQQMTIGELVAFLSYMRLFFRPMRELSQKYSIVQSALASAERIFQLLDNKANADKTGHLSPSVDLKGKIRFERVNFGYNQDIPVLREASFTVYPGETVALRGPTGIGKSTIINLLEKFYEPEQGKIYLDDYELTKLSSHWVRRQLGLVMQDVFVLSASLRDNIVLDTEIDDSRLMEIVKMAKLSSLIDKLPQGWDTSVGEGGLELSAGQRQLLALARVLARDPAILILDEATSNIDTPAEHLLEEAITETMSERTTIIIAHRPSSLKQADRILDLKGGKITEKLGAGFI
ncbi:MAG: ABC transporter ATP-binding protein [Thermodesulfobacteriota bacterium]